jgi:hypothetical protein
MVDRSGGRDAMELRPDSSDPSFGQVSRNPTAAYPMRYETWTRRRATGDLSRNLTRLASVGFRDIRRGFPARVRAKSIIGPRPPRQNPRRGLRMVHDYAPQDLAPDARARSHRLGASRRQSRLPTHRQSVGSSTSPSHRGVHVCGEYLLGLEARWCRENGTKASPTTAVSLRMR